MGKKRDLRKRMRKRGLEGAPAVVICTGTKCCPHRESRALVEATREYIEATAVTLVTVGCLGVCTKGPIVATYPTIRFRKHATAKRVRKLVDKTGS